MSARQRGITGTAELLAYVGPDGQVVRIEVHSGPEALVQAASDAVRGWRWKPLERRGRPCLIITPITVNFALR